MSEILTGIKHVFFDLDNTLWDFDGNSSEALAELYSFFKLEDLNIPSEERWLKQYKVRNEEIWKAYREGRVDQSRLRWQRFDSTLADFGKADRQMAIEMSEKYLDLVSSKSKLLPGANELLEQLHGAFEMHIITNGFEEVQQRKMALSGMGRFFGEIVTSERAGAVKPSMVIFNFALEAAGAVASESIYVGDKGEVDGAAEKAGMHFFHYNPAGKESTASRQLRHLLELPDRFSS